MIEESYFEKQNSEGSFDIFSETIFKNNFKILQSNIKKKAMLHEEFWLELSGHRPGHFLFFSLIFRC